MGGFLMATAVATFLINTFGASAIVASTISTLVVNTLISTALGALTSKSGSSSSQEAKEQNYQGGENTEKVFIGKNKVGGTAFMLQNAEVGGVDLVYYGLSLDCHHPIQEMTKIWIGDKTLDHPDFSNVVLAEYDIDFSNRAATDGLVTLVIEGTTYSYTSLPTDTVADIRDALFNQISAPADFEVTSVDTGLWSINVKRISGTVADWDIDITIDTANVCDSVVDLVKGKAETKKHIRIIEDLGDQTMANPIWVSELMLNTTVSQGYDSASIGYRRPKILFSAERSWLRDNLGGVPQITVEILGHNDLLDPRTGLRGYSTNPIVVAYNMFLDENLWGVEADDLPLTEWQAEANICDEQVQIKADGATENRYEFNGAYEYDTPSDVLALIEPSIRGHFVERGFSYIPRCGANRTPVMHITQEMIRGGFTHSPTIPLASRLNRVAGTYTEPLQEYGVHSYPSVLLADGERTLTGSFNQNNEISAWRAQRNAYNYLQENNNKEVLSFHLRALDLPTDLVQAGDFVTIDNSFITTPAGESWVVLSRDYERDTSSQIVLELRPDANYAWDYNDATEVEQIESTALFVVNENLS